MSVTYTSNLNLGKHSAGDLNWHTTVNGNFDTIDTAIGAQHTPSGVHTDITASTIAVTGSASFGSISGNLVMSGGATAAGVISTGDVEISDTNKLQLRDSGIYINSSTDGQLDAVADAKIQLSSPVIDLVVSGTTVSGTELVTLTNGSDASSLHHHAVPPDVSFDFTGTDYDTKTKCQAAGILFSDSDTPFPTKFHSYVDTATGAWTHSASHGWYRSAGADVKSTAIMIPLNRPRDWYATVLVEYAPTDVGEKVLIMLDSITVDHNTGASACLLDTDAAANSLYARLDGKQYDGTLSTGLYTGTAMTGAADRLIGLSYKNGCIGIYDDYDDSWNYITSEWNAGGGFQPAYVAIQVYKLSGVDLPPVYIKNFNIYYY